MATMEQVEKLREKANVTYDEAKTALEASGDDILDAIIYLERQGKVEPPKNNGFYSSENKEEHEKKSEQSYNEYDYSKCGETFHSLAKKFFKWCGKMISKGNANSFEVRRFDRVIISIPVTVLVILLFLAFWVIVPLIVIGLFFNCRYFFKGPDLEKTGVNKVMDSAANAAENIKRDVKNSNNEKQ